MILYHGSNMAISAIDLCRGRRGKDFGQGFYLSADLQQARNMAANVVDREAYGEPTVTAFEINETLFSDGTLSVKAFPEYSIEWTRFVLANRQNKSGDSLHSYDVVYGPIADDKVGVQMRRFERHYIDEETLMKELRFKEPTFQYFFGTEKAVSYLKNKGIV